MHKGPFFLEPLFKERIWGGDRLKTDFGYGIPTTNTGEAWVISAHPEGTNVIANGPLKGKTLADAWSEHGGIFNRPTGSKEDYPLLVKLLDAAEDLSVQVHPDDGFAREVEGAPYGKTECWYVLRASEGADLFLGHHAQTREELELLIDQGEWDCLLRRLPVQAGDFFYVPSGTVHAIGKGITILEIQQSSDVTYRVYDYDRKDKSGSKRELHLDKSKQVIRVPHVDAQTEMEQTKTEDLLIRRLVQEEYFTVYHWILDGEAKQMMKHDFLQVTMVDGTAILQAADASYPVQKGDSFILPYGLEEYRLTGCGEFIVSHI